MITNTKILAEMGGLAEDNEHDVEYEWNLVFEDVLNGILIDGRYFENTELEHEFELAKEAELLYDQDMASSRAYYV